MERNDTTGRATRRQLIRGLGAGVGAGGAVVLAGCLGGSQSGADPVPVRGDPEADVTLEVFADLNCPACAAYNEGGFPDIRSQFIEENLVRYEFRNFITTGNGGEQAANAAREVFEQRGNDAFWEYKTAMYSNQGRIQTESPQVFADVASDVGLGNPEEIAQAGDERPHQSTIESDVDRARSLGLPGTPSFVVDGNQVDTRGASTTQQLVNRVSQQVRDALGSQ